MIKYNNSNINDWYYDTSDLVKVYKGGAVCYYKVGGTPPSPTSQTPCFAVVDDISQYQDTEFEDVFNNADGKWYKLNNLGQYEKYGVYGSGKNITYYEGKLTVDDGYEYQYSGGSWVNVGEVSGNTRLPQGYTEVEYVENASSAYINTNLVLLENVGDSFEIKLKTYFTPYSNDFEYLFGTEQTSSPYTGIQLRYYKRNLQYNGDSNVVWTHIYNGDGTSGVTASCSSINATNGGNPLTLFCGLWSTGPWRFGRGKIYSFTVTKNNSIVRDLVPCKRDSDSKYGMYDIVGGSFYISPNSYLLSGGSATTDIVYPLYYDEKQDPPNNVSFSSMTEAEEYECPWVGMKAKIDGDNYIFSGDSTSGYEWVYKASRLPQGYTEVEYLENSSYVANTKSTTRFNVIGDSASGNIYTIIYDMEDDGGSHYMELFGNNVNVFMQKITQNWANKCIHFKYYGLYAYVEATPLSTKAMIEMDSSSIVITDITASTSTTTTYGGSLSNVNETHYGVFCFYNTSDSGAHSMVGKIYEIKIESSTHVLKNNYIPCYRDSDNKVGLYDIVGGAFYYDESNELTLSVGPEV